MREARWRWVATAVVIALLSPGAAHADRRRERRSLPATARPATSSPLRPAVQDPALEAAVQRLQTGLAGGAQQGAAASREAGRPYVARSSSGHVRALVAPPGRSWSPAGEDATPEGRALAFLNENRLALGWARAGATLDAGSVRRLAGRSVVRFEQRLAGLRVFGAAAVVQVESSGGVSFVLADLARDGARLYEPGFPIAPRVDPQEALDVARGLVPGDRPPDLAAQAPELMVYEPSVIGNEGPSQLVWYVRVRSDVALVNEVVLVDAETGAVAFHYSDIKDAKNRSIYDAANVSGSLGTLVRSEGQPPSGIADADSAYTFIGDTYDFYFSRFGRDSYDGAGAPLVGRVRYCQAGGPCPMANAFWNGSEMRFGQGYAVDDVTAHELTHAVTQSESNLIYWSESGAINEALSDIFGEFVDLTNSSGNDTPAVRWQIGEDLPGGAIRSMSDPTLFFQPDRRFSPNWWPFSQDNRGVHTNSGVANKLAFLLTDGGTFNGQTVAAQGLTETTRLFYEAETNLLVPASDYIDLYVALRQAAINVGWDGARQAALDKASQAVEIAVPGAMVTIFSDGFEGPFPGSWQILDQGGISGTGLGTQWGRTSFRKASGSFSAYCAAGGVSPSPPGGPYKSFMDTWMIYGPFPLTAVQDAWAEFDVFIDVEPLFGDDIFWGVSTDGFMFDGIAVQPDPPGSTGGFVHEVLNFKDVLITVVGQPQVWFAFNFVSDNIVEQEGVYVDNVAIMKGIAQSSDLSVTKTDGVSQVTAGQPVTYTIQVSNAGPDAVVNARVQDTFPATLTGINWTCTASAGSSCAAASGTGSIDRTVSLLSGGTATFVATATLDLAASGTLVNTATVSLPNGWTDANLANNTATDTDTILIPADVSVTKTDGQATATAGQPISYTIVVGNAGPNAVNGVTVSDIVPASLPSSTWTCVAAGGASCAAGGSPNIVDTVNLPVGGTATYTLNATVSATPISLSNTVTATLPAGFGDPNPSNNSATDTDLLLCGNQTAVTPDGRVSSATVAAGATQWLVFGTHAGYSHSIEVHDPLGASFPGTPTLFRGDDGCTGSSTATFTDTTAIDPVAPANAVRYAFTASGSDPNYRLRFTNPGGAPVDYVFSLAETTLFSPSWTTNGSYDTYYSVQNTTNTTITATLTFSRVDGTSAGAITLPISPGVTASTNTIALGTPRNTSGTARLTHNGPPGALLTEAAVANFSFATAYIQPVRFKSVRETR